AIERWAEVLARRFAHIPCLGLKGLLYSGPDGSIEAFLDGLEPEFADELRGALKRGTAAAQSDAAGRGAQGDDAARHSSARRDDPAPAAARPSDDATQRARPSDDATRRATRP